jgi:hypothetical protein
VNIFPTIIKGATDFAALGLEANSQTNSAAGLGKNGFAVSFDPSTGTYVIDLPSSAPGGFYQNLVNTPNNRFWNGTIGDTPEHSTIGASVLQPRSTNPEIQLTYTTFAFYSDADAAGQPHGVVAFGVPTPSANVPVTGSATYNAQAYGTLYASDLAVRGSVSLQFNFGAGTLAGSFDPYIADYLAGNTPLGHYDFTNTVYGVGSATFSGELSKAGGGDHGTFDGLFTGPSAQELMARWATSQMFGVWVGKKQ